MIHRTLISSTIALLWSLSWPTPGAARQHPLSMDQAVALAIAQSPAVKQASHQLGEVGARRRSVRGQLLPRLSIDANVFVWDSAVEFNLAPDMTGSTVDPSCAATLGCLAPLLQSFDVGPVRDQVTSQITVQLMQPITPLYSIYQGYKATRQGEAAVRSALKLSRQQVAGAARRGYIQIKQAGSGVKIARAAVEQVERQLVKARAFEKAGLIGRNDLLKLEVARAQAAGAVIKAEAGLSMAQSALAVAAGLPRGDTIVASQQFADPPPAFSKTLDQCFTAALSARPELGSVKAQAAMASASREAARGAMIPTLAALGAYQHNEGMGFAQPKNVFFFGASLKWDVWDWGTKYYAYREAASKVDRSKLDEQRLRDAIFLQVKKSYLDLKTAAQELAIARVTIRQAEEGYRIEKIKFEKNSATTSDLVDAQAALTRVQQTFNNALHGWYISRAALEQAMGQSAPRKAR